MISQKIRKTIQSGWIIVVALLLFGCNSNPEPQWPDITQEHKPWTRWWWMGNAVNNQDLTRQMELYREANLGGVEITPIYGVAGYEDQFTDFLSPEWMEKLEHTLAEGERLNLGIDMATGTGWPFGGPWIGENEASKRLYYKTYEVNGGERLSENISYTQESFLRSINNTIYELHGFLRAEGEETEGTMDQPLRNPENDPVNISDIQQPLRENDNLQELAIEQVRFEKSLPLTALMAYSENDEVINLTEQVDENGTLDWEAPAGNWTLYALFSGLHGKTVERAAPGGEGFVIDHFSNSALQHYLATFDSSFTDHNIGSLRSFFNDSYEVDDAEGEANWTPDFFTAFEEKRGYDLKGHLPALLEEQHTEIGIRVLTDYRETISELLLEKFTEPWDEWSEQHGALIRNQAHGSPANILDLYAASDIPETEGTDIIRAKMASSAANVTGKQLISSEAATWLDEHFSSSLSDVKRAVDRFFVSGINHTFYHGTAYSPAEDEWPGWLFYAAVHFNERNPFWNQFADFNSYVSRVQSFLQSGTPDNDILMYFPIYDQWAEPGPGLLRHFDGGLEDVADRSFLKMGAELMVERGYSFDFVSDLQLENTAFEENHLKTEGGSYQTIVVPKSRFIPLPTFQNLVKLAEEGATVISFGGLPKDVPGLVDLEERQRQFDTLVNQLRFEATEREDVEEAIIGEGRFIRSESLEALLNYSQIERESMTDLGLQFMRRNHDSGHVYFITNWGDEKIDQWIQLSIQDESAHIFDPSQEKSGVAAFREMIENDSEIYLQLDPGESRIVKTFNSGSSSSTYPYFSSSGEAQSISGPWTLSFVDGGPGLPAEQQVDSPVLWTDFDEELYHRFSGTAHYQTTFEIPSESHDGWLLNLGEVHEGAIIYINDEKAGTLIGPEYELLIKPEWLLDEQNDLTIEVSNLMANRISWMEREGIQWKKFYNVNFPARLGANRNRQGIFDASGWSPRPSGLAGPVTLTPVKLFKPEDS